MDCVYWESLFVVPTGNAGVFAVTNCVHCNAGKHDMHMYQNTEI